MEQKALTYTVLLTRDEYIAFRVRQKKQDRKERLPLLTFAGAVGFLAGAAGLFFGDLIQMTAGTSLCLLLLGLFCFVYDGMIAPLLDGGAAAKEYDGKEELRMATTFVFEGDRVTVDNGRVKGNLPLRLVTRWDVLAGQFSFAFGRELSFVIPARLLDESQTAELKNRMETVSRETPESRNTGGKAAV